MKHLFLELGSSRTRQTNRRVQCVTGESFHKNTIAYTYKWTNQRKTAELTHVCHCLSSLYHAGIFHRLNKMILIKTRPRVADGMNNLYVNFGISKAFLSWVRVNIIRNRYWRTKLYMFPTCDVLDFKLVTRITVTVESCARTTIHFVTVVRTILVTVTNFVSKQTRWCRMTEPCSDCCTWTRWK